MLCTVDDVTYPEGDAKKDEEYRSEFESKHLGSPRDCPVAYRSRGLGGNLWLLRLWCWTDVSLRGSVSYVGLEPAYAVLT